jgi:hypothetical protein
MDRSRLLISLPLLAALSVSVFGSTACEKKPPPAAAVDAGGPPPAPSDTAPVVLTPLDDSLDSGTDAPPPKPRGPGGGGNTNAARIKQCCNALRSQAKNMGGSPEANIVVGLAAQCDLIAIQAAGGTAPEFAQLRSMLKGRTIPAACSGM